MAVPRNADVPETPEDRRASASYARGLIEASLDPLVTISPAGRITDVNKATEQATGLGRDELIGTEFADYFTDPQAARAGYERVLREGIVRDFELTLRHASGSTIDVLYNATVYRDESGADQGVFAAARDVTERKRAEATIRELNASLEQRVRERTADLQARAAELQAANAELARFNRVAVDRELRMIELKQQVNELCERDGLPARYRIAALDEAQAAGAAGPRDG